MLELIAEGHRPLATVAAQARLNLSTAHHLVKTLEGLGYVSRGPDRTYRIASRGCASASARRRCPVLRLLPMIGQSVVVRWPCRSRSFRPSRAGKAPGWSDPEDWKKMIAVIGQAATLAKVPAPEQVMTNDLLP